MTTRKDEGIIWDCFVNWSETLHWIDEHRSLTIGKRDRTEPTQ